MRDARRVQSRGGQRKIEELRKLARDEAGVAAACLLAAMGKDVHPTEAATARAYVGALLILECHTELQRIRKALTAPKEG